jgi:hypothetical protein
MEFKRQKLLTVEQYAQKLGVSTNVVNDCIRNGCIKTRSLNGKKYVVDIPPGPFFSTAEIPTNPHPSCSERPVVSMVETGRTTKNESQTREISPGSIAKLTEKMLNKASEIKEIIARINSSSSKL